MTEGGVSLISVCIASHRRPEQLEACLKSLALQEDAPEFEVLVCANGDAGVERTVEAIFPQARTWVVGRAHPGAARNILIDNAAGDLLLFLDDDVVAHPRLLHRLGTVAEAHPYAQVFGGPNVTPPESNRFQRLQGAVLASLIGSGPVRRRYGRHPAGTADERFFTLCNLAIRREAMTHFDIELVCAEENALLIELSDHNMEMRYDPGLHVFHERRPTLRSFLQQTLKYGRGRGQIIARRPTSVRPSFVAPVLLVLYLLALPVLAFADSLWLLPLALYGAVVLAEAIKIAITFRRISRLIPSAGLMVMLHLSYGIGVLVGALGPKREFRRRTTVREEGSPAGSRRAVDHR